MALSMAVAGGKGGVTKSAIAGALGVSYKSADWDVLVADYELGQATARKFNQRRIEAGLSPICPVQSFGSVSQIIEEIQRGGRDLVIVDCPAFASKSTVEIAQAVDMLILPTAFTEDDMNSTAETANSLVLAGIDPKKIVIVFSGVAEGDTPREQENDRIEAGNYWSELPYFIIAGYIPRKKSLGKALDSGRVITECIYSGPRRKADHVIQAIITRFEEITEGKE